MQSPLHAQDVSSDVLRNHASKRGLPYLVSFLEQIPDGAGGGERRNPPRALAGAAAANGLYKSISKYADHEISDANIRTVICSYYIALGADEPDNWFGHNGTIDTILGHMKVFKDRVNARKVLRTLRSIIEAWDKDEEWSPNLISKTMGAPVVINIKSSLFKSLFF